MDTFRRSSLLSFARLFDFFSIVDRFRIIYIVFNPIQLNNGGSGWVNYVSLLMWCTLVRGVNYCSLRADSKVKHKRET